MAKDKYGLEFFSDKAGQSPGSIMTDGEKLYMVKLGVPNVHESIKLKSDQDLENFMKDMAKSSCEEKIFFNIAEAVGDNKFILPQTSVVLVKPIEYAGRNCSVKKKLSSKFNLSRFKFEEDELPLNKVLRIMNDTSIHHFASRIIEPYENISEFYTYHELDENAKSDMRQRKYIRDDVPLEPHGIGAFFALNTFTGNRDCIGISGANAGIDERSFKIIVIDGGLAQQNPDISTIVPISSNARIWFDYNELSMEAQREACEAFQRIAMLNDVEIRKIITNDEQFTRENVFTNQEVEQRIDQFIIQQGKLVSVFYDLMLKNGCVNDKIMLMKTRDEQREAQEERVKKAQREAAMLNTKLTSPPRKTGKRLFLNMELIDENTPPQKQAGSVMIIDDAAVAKLDFGGSTPKKQKTGLVR